MYNSAFCRFTLEQYKHFFFMYLFFLKKGGWSYFLFCFYQNKRIGLTKFGPWWESWKCMNGPEARGVEKKVQKIKRSFVR